MEHCYRAAAQAPEPTVIALSAPALNVDVRQRAFDPFFRGLAVGVLATLAGVILGWMLLPI